MRNEREAAASILRGALDWMVVAYAFVFAYALAIHNFPRALSRGVPDFDRYLDALPLIVGIFAINAFLFRLYRPRAVGDYTALGFDLGKVTVQTAVILLAISFYYRGFSYSRLILTNFFVICPLLIFGTHIAWMGWERRRSHAGIGMRRCLVIGTGSLAAGVDDRIASHLWSGLSVLGFVRVADGESSVYDERVLGTLDDLETLIEEHGVQEIVVALPFAQMAELTGIDQRLARVTVGLRWVPDLESVNTIWREVSEIGDYPLINLRGVRAKGFDLLAKRVLDVVCSLILLVVLSPLLLTIAVAIRVLYGSPVLFCQDRMGLDGQVFTLYKFRTMRNDAEGETGPVFAKRDDPRTTRFGAFLRTTSLDELPQLWNILLGQMSLVGPRPERPVFIEEFKETVPRYMFRHWMKAGLTGWAQVNGWRGDTSLEKRIQCDLYYLENWTLWLDVKILVLTLFKGWGKNKNAY